MNPLIIGESPSRTSDPKRPLTGRRGDALAELFGVATSTYLAKFDRANLLQEYPGRAGKGARFDADAAWKASFELFFSLRRRPRPFVLVLGKRAARAMGYPRVEYFAPMDFIGTTGYVIPHPSGINRWRNDPKNRVKAKRFVRRLTP